MDTFSEKFLEINKQLDLQNQNWLFGAGISRNANIPLMGKLTELIEDKLNAQSKFNETYRTILTLFSNKKNMHIEHILSHIGDLIALIERTEGNELTINDYKYSKSHLYSLYDEIIELITEIVRYGNCEESEEEGSIANPLVKIDEHRKFIRGLFSRLDNLERRSSINFFTTNYDTLLEDALILEGKKIIDGFEGGAMGFWNPIVFEEKSNDKYCVFKLHGSIDWYKSEAEGLVRTRYGTTYLKDKKNTMIYPQATKYVETQKDPFAILFDKFREILNSSKDSILGVCGYSFGDDHINSEIESALLNKGNQLTLLVFIDEDKEAGKCLPSVLQKWNNTLNINERVYIMTPSGIYNNGNFFTENCNENKCNFSWWKFDGLTELLIKGEEYQNV